MNEGDGEVLIEIVQKTVDGRVGVDIKYNVKDIGIGTLLDLGSYFTNLGRNQRILTNPPEGEVEASKTRGRRIKNEKD